MYKLNYNFICILGTPAALTEEDLPADLFSVLFQCQDHPQPSWRALLAYSIGLQRPLLALLASYYEVREEGSNDKSPQIIF